MPQHHFPPGLRQLSLRQLSLRQLSLRQLSLRQSQLWVIMLGLTCLSACAASDAQPNSAKSGGARPVPVVMATATQKTVPVFVQTTGTVQAYSTVSVKSQIAGQLMEVNFKEGQEVQKGDLLFTIDPRPLQASLQEAMANRAKAIAQVSQAEADLAQAEAQVNQARANVTKESAQASNNNVQARRYDSLQAEGAVSREQADQFRTSAAAQSAVVAANQSSVQNTIAAVDSAQANVQSAQATVSAADAAVDSAQLQLSYSAIYSPVDGRTGSLKVNQGNLVQANDNTNPLVVISQIRPIYVGFSVPQRLLPDLKKYQAQGRLKVDVTSAKSAPVQGELEFVDSAVDTTTGTIQLKATFSNAGNQLTPGQFVNVRLKLTDESNAIVVPTQAVQTGQKGQFVYVVKTDKTVELRPVTPGVAVDSQTVIQQGLKPGERVVTDGQFNLVPGATVQESGQSGAGQSGAGAEKSKQGG